MDESTGQTTELPVTIHRLISSSPCSAMGNSLLKMAAEEHAVVSHPMNICQAEEYLK